MGDILCMCQGKFGHVGWNHLWSYGTSTQKVQYFGVEVVIIDMVLHYILNFYTKKICFIIFQIKNLIIY